jgi:hypothetical protein
MFAVEHEGGYPAVGPPPVSGRGYALFTEVRSKGILRSSLPALCIAPVLQQTVLYRVSKDDHVRLDTVLLGGKEDQEYHARWPYEPRRRCPQDFPDSHYRTLGEISEGCGYVDCLVILASAFRPVI